MNVFSMFRRQNSVVKLAVGLRLPGGVGTSHGTTGTMVNPALVRRLGSYRSVAR